MSRPEQGHDDPREEGALRAALQRASRDAPRRDLWPRLEADVRALGRPRRRWFVWPRPARLLAPVALSLALIVALVFGNLAMNRKSPPVASFGGVTDLLLALEHQPPSEVGNYAVAVYRPGSVERQPLLAGVADTPTVAPDGRQLYFVVQRRVGADVRSELVALDGATLARQWSVELGAQLESEAGAHPILARVVATAERVYVATFRLGTGDAPQVRGLARGDGALVASWPIGVEGREVGEVNLLAAPDGRQLHLFARTAADAAGIRDRYVAIALPSGRQEVRPIGGDPMVAAAFYGAGGRITPDGRSFYRLVYTGRLAFFDLARGTRPTELLLPFADISAGLAPLGQGVSPDGRTLYALAPLGGQLAIIDLAGQRVERVVQLGGVPARRDGGPLGRLREWLVPGVAASTNLTPAIQVSPDGRYLYAAGAAGGRLGGVWVIAVDGWRIVQHLAPGQDVDGLLLLDQGRSLAVHGGGRLRLFQAPNWQPLADQAEGAVVFTSLAELFREEYGRAPGAQP